MEPGVCVTVEALSALLDEELAGDEKTRVEQHLRYCSDCTNRLKELEGTDRLLINGMEQSTKLDEHSRSSDCVNDDVLCSYLHDALTADQRISLESHLDGCDRCLAELSAVARTDSLPHLESSAPVPGYLRERVESLWKEGEAARDRIVKIVCRLAQDGIEFLRDSLIPQGLTFQGVFAATGAYRSAGERSMPSSILFKGELNDLRLALSVVWEREDRAGLTLQLQDEQSRPMPSQRILLHREKVLIHSERTDVGGLVRIHDLNPGVYQLGIVISGKESSIDIEVRSN